MITIHIPKGSEAPDLKKEISSARNIKDKSNRDATISGLNSIIHYL
jgi:hypothetical protein